MKHALILLLLAAPTAFAITIDNNNDEYLGASIDYINHGLRVNETGNPAKSTENQATGYSLRAGFYSNSYLSWEMEYADAGSADRYYAQPGFNDDHLEVSQRSFSLSAIGHLPLNETFGLYGRIGFARMTGKGTFDSQATGQSGSVSARATKPVIGIGMEAKLNNGWRAYTELTQFSKLKYGEHGSWPSDSQHVRRLLAGVSYHY